MLVAKKPLFFVELLQDGYKAGLQNASSLNAHYNNHRRVYFIAIKMTTNNDKHTFILSFHIFITSKTIKYS